MRAGDSWSVDSTCGVQQGAPPSAGIFAIILGNLLQMLCDDWADKGIKHQHVLPDGTPCYGWIILNMQDWSSLDSCLTGLQKELATVGLLINFDKTVIIVPDTGTRHHTPITLYVNANGAAKGHTSKSRLSILTMVATSANGLLTIAPSLHALVGARLGRFLVRAAMRMMNSHTFSSIGTFCQVFLVCHDDGMVAKACQQPTTPSCFGWHISIA